MKAPAFALAALCAAAALSGDAAGPENPSRPPAKGCAWEKLSDPALGLEAWVQRCDFGFRKVDFLVRDHSLLVRYSDGGAPDPVVDVLEMASGESAESALKRIFAARTDKAIASRCVLAPYRGSKTPTGVKRFSFVPGPAYAKEVEAKASPDEVGEPPCGEWGEAPDGIQYFEAHPASGARRVLFVRVGQDEPLFDENTLRLMPPR